MAFYDFDGKSYPCHLLSPVNLGQEELAQINSVDYCNADDFALHIFCYSLQRYYSRKKL